MLNLGQLNTIKSYMDNGQFEAMDEYLKEVYSKQQNEQFRLSDMRPLIPDSYGTVTLIWDGRYRAERPIMGIIRGTVYEGDRYSSYILKPNNNFCLEVFTRVELRKFSKWLLELNNGLKKR